MGATLEAGTILASVRSETTDLEFSGVLRDGGFVAQGEQGLRLELKLTPEWIDAALAPKLPEGARIALPAESKPLTLRVKDLRVPLAPPAVAAAPAAKSVHSGTNGTNGTNGAAHAGTNGAQDAAKEDAGGGLAAALERLAGLTLEAELVVPELVYSDAKTAAANRPIAIRA
jgi:hypothetical protein